MIDFWCARHVPICCHAVYNTSDLPRARKFRYWLLEMPSHRHLGGCSETLTPSCTCATQEQEQQEQQEQQQISLLVSTVFEISN